MFLLFANENNKIKFFFSYIKWFFLFENINYKQQEKVNSLKKFIFIEITSN
jgi:hypothetical protein